ncbi:MAG: hypothetical protein KGL39_51810, partial [Patescibacteria group bacterium]|nr:hypothetical protein [Patescibacteria group bacterium]
VVTSGSNVLTSASANFIASDVGRTVTDSGGSNYIPAGTTISSVTNATTVVMSNNASNSATGDYVTIGSQSTSLGVYNFTMTAGSRISNTKGYNPAGKQTAPTVPASGTTQINPFPFDASVYISGGTVTAIEVGNIATPSGLALTTATTGGALAASTAYEYQVTAVNQVGETLACTAVSLTTGSTTSTNTITATWQPVTGATSYNIYGRISGSIAKIANVTSPTYIDTGSVAPSGALPTSDTTGTSTGLTSGQFFIPAGEGLQLTYSAAPTWVWIGN